MKQTRLLLVNISRNIAAVYKGRHKQNYNGYKYNVSEKGNCINVSDTDSLKTIF